MAYIEIDNALKLRIDKLNTMSESLHEDPQSFRGKVRFSMCTSKNAQLPFQSLADIVRQLMEQSRIRTEEDNIMNTTKNFQHAVE